MKQRTSMTKPTLFLDRDGVINKFESGKFVNKVEDFVFAEGALAALKTLADIFGRIFIVSNQQGVARGYLTLQDVDEIHAYMLGKINEAGGRIDRIYTCPELDGALCRKPEPGMALQAKEDFPEIDFNDSFMVGDLMSDLEFGKRLGMITVLIGKEVKLEEVHLIDFCCESLYEFSVKFNIVLRTLERIKRKFWSLVREDWWRNQ